MKNRVKVFFSYALFWLAFFVVARLLFLIYHFDKTSGLDFGDVILAMLHGLRLDLSTMGYFTLLPGLFLVISCYLKPIVTRILFEVYTVALLVFCVFVVILDLEMYTNWEFRLDATPLLYIGQDTTIPIDYWSLTKLVLLGLAVVVIALLTYIKLVTPQIEKLERADWKSSLVLLLLTAALIAPIRGTTGIAPINTGMVYFHPNEMFANHAAINVVYNTGYALSKMNRLKYPGNFLEQKKTATYFEKLYASSGETQKLIHVNKPNILLIILESYTFRFIEPLGGIEGVAPNLNVLSKEGVLFNNFYSSGDRTDKGIVSILSGYPAQPTGSIIKYPKKTQKLPFINKSFEEMGYTTGFTYGGNIDFANFRSYLSAAGFDQLTHSGAFPDSLNQSKWGVHDEFVFRKVLNELDQTNQPFFKVMLTLSSHEPFEVPMETVIKGEDPVSKFMNSAHYTDRALGEFIANAKKTDWWDSTLLVITADHGHGMPDNGGNHNPNRFKIPMLWLGGALQSRDTVISTFGSQTDIPNTLLAQVAKPDPSFMFSSNMLDKDHPDFSVYIFNNGYGYIDDEFTLIYDNVGKQFIEEHGVVTEEDKLPGMAYMQKLYNDYNRR